MALDDSTILDIETALDGADLHLRWTSTGPASATYQIYLEGRLAWSGTGRSATIPAPLRPASVFVGAVGDGEAEADFSASVPPAGKTGDRVRLAWEGGSYLDASGLDDVAEYRIYGSPGSGRPCDFDAPLATLSAYPPGTEPADGFGRGGFGRGGFGRAATSYAWTSGRLASGIWEFAVRPVDVAGNERQSPAVPIALECRPLAPAANKDGGRLSRSFDAPTGVVTLSWLPSPG